MPAQRPFEIGPVACADCAPPPATVRANLGTAGFVYFQLDFVVPLVMGELDPTKRRPMWVLAVAVPTVTSHHIRRIADVTVVVVVVMQMVDDLRLAEAVTAAAAMMSFDAVTAIVNDSFECDIRPTVMQIACTMPDSSTIHDPCYVNIENSPAAYGSVAGAVAATKRRNDDGRRAWPHVCSVQCC